MTVRAVCGMRHAVAVDTWCDPGLIYDGVESRPMRLRTKSVALCVGEDKLLECIEDVRLLRWRATAKEGKKPHKKKRKRREEYESGGVQASE